MSQPPGNPPHPDDQNAGFGSPPSSGPDFVGNGPDFVGAGHSAPDAGPPPAYQDFRQSQNFQQSPPPAGTGPQPPIQPTIQPARGGGPKPWLIVTALVVLLALLGGGLYFGRGLFGGGEEPPRPTPTPGRADLPETPAIEAPAVIDEVAATAGLTCHDEAVNPRKVKGCYLQEENHLVTMRYLINDQGDITKVNAQVLLNGAEPQERGEELLALLEPVMATLPISDDDRDTVRSVIADPPEDPVNERIDWGGQPGTFDHRSSVDVTTASVGDGNLDFVPQVPLVEDHAAVIDELTARGWTCETEDVVLTCEAAGLGKLTGSLSKAGQPDNEPRLTRIQVWFDGQVPTPDEDRMVDVYTALSQAGERGEVMATGLRLLCEGEKQFFNSDVEFYRGDSYYELGGVQFI